jgi:hypothetical protein
MLKQFILTMTYFSNASTDDCDPDIFQSSRQAETDNFDYVL